MRAGTNTKQVKTEQWFNEIHFNDCRLAEKKNMQLSIEIIITRLRELLDQKCYKQRKYEVEFVTNQMLKDKIRKKNQLQKGIQEKI